PIRTEQEGRVLSVTLDNPPRQFQDRALTFELHGLLKALERDHSVGAVVITGAHPRSFLTHYDVAEILGGALITPDLPPPAFGAARAVEMLLEARHYSPREAVEVGLVHRVVDPECLLQEARATAERLAKRSPRAVWASKRVAYRGPSARWPAGFQPDRTGFLW